jgi:hypothetical protein
MQASDITLGDILQIVKKSVAIEFKTGGAIRYDFVSTRYYKREGETIYVLYVEPKYDRE